MAYGHAGYPLLMFPTAAADYLEYERFYLVDAIKDFIEAGTDPCVFDQFGKQIQSAKPRIASRLEGRDAVALRQLHHGRGFAADPQ